GASEVAIAQPSDRGSIARAVAPAVWGDNHQATPASQAAHPGAHLHGWSDVQPGFLEADLVAHCGGSMEGAFLYTLTLTDVATTWTECLPLLHRSQHGVIQALQRARGMFPFPLLGIDTDNGSEFINEDLLAYCADQQLTFTRG